MFTTGFDLGTQYCVIAVARKGGIDVVSNEASYRQTPALVCYADDQRYLGQSAQVQQKRQVSVTLCNVKKLLGRRFDDPFVQRERQLQGADLVECADGSVGLNTEKYGVVSAVEACAALLGQLKRTTEAATGGAAVRDVVIGVPGSWTDAQRRALLDAAHIAGLNPLQLINELTAAALELGIRKDPELAADQKDVLVFFDMGASQTQCSVVRYSKGKLEVLAQESDEALGGRDFDQVLVQHFRDEWLQKYKIDINTNQKALLRVNEAVVKLKHVLSSVDRAPINIECLMDDKDVASSLTREDFQRMSAHLIERVKAPLQRVLDRAGVAASDVVTVEVVGDAHRMPAVMQVLEEFFGRAPSRRTNATEAIAKGCAWQCARRSPVFRVRDYELLDSQPYAVEFAYAWAEGGERPQVGDEYRALFQPNTAIGSKKGFRKVEFNMKDLAADGRTFATTLRYAEGVALPEGLSRSIGTWMVSGIPKDPEGLEKPSVLNLGIKCNDSGVFALTKAMKEWTAVEEYEAEEEVPVEEEQKKEEAEEEKVGEKKEEEGDEKKEPEEKPAEDKKPKTKKVKITKSKKVPRSLKLTITESDTASLSQADLAAAKQKEYELHQADRLVVETNELKNQVETYCYEFRDRLASTLEEYATEEEAQRLRDLMTSTEEWLYEEGENETKAVYAARLDAMTTIGDPIEQRYRESTERPEACARLQNAINEWREWVASTDEKYEHIGADERKKVADKAAEVEQWLQKQMDAQRELKPTDKPAFLATEVNSKFHELQSFCKPIFNTPKPKPKEPEKPKEGDEKPKEGEEKPKEGEEKPKEADDVPPLEEDVPPADDNGAKPMDTSE